MEYFNKNSRRTVKNHKIDNPIINSGIELRGQWGFGQLRIEIFEKLVTLGISKNSLYKANFSSFWTFYA